MKEFIIEHYHELISLVSAVIVILITVFKKKVKIFGSIYEEILRIAPYWIQEVENSELKGEKKLNECVACIKAQLGTSYPGVNLDFYTKFIKQSVENILSTPQKKGDF